MAGEVTNIRLADLQTAVLRMEERIVSLEAERVRGEQLFSGMAELKDMLKDHVRTDSELEKRITALQLQMAAEIAKLQKAVLIAILGGAGAGATAMKLVGTLLGG